MTPKPQPIRINGHTISPIVVSTFMGHSGDRIFDIPPLITNLWPPYRKLRQVIKERNVTVFTKTSTLPPNIGNYRKWNPFTYKYIRNIGDGGMLNAYGQTNDGLRVNAPKIASACRTGFQVIPNFYPQFSHGRVEAISETLYAIDIYCNCLGQSFWAIELVYSCPNSREKIKDIMDDALACTKLVRNAYPREKLCLIVKISILHPYAFSQELVKIGVDVIHGINAIPYGEIYPDKLSPLASVGGGAISGGPAFEKTYRYNEGLREAIPDTNIIMGCGITNCLSAEAYFKIGANADSICTVCKRDTNEAVRIIEDFCPA